MPRYQWLIKNELDNSTIQDKMRTMVTLGVPYTEADINNALKHMDEQASKIEANLLANPDIKNHDGLTPKEKAIQEGKTDLAEIFDQNKQ